jgi:hypothetical protein
MNPFRCCLIFACMFCFLQSCRHETEEIAAEYYPAINFVSGLNYISSNQVMPKNNLFRVGINANSNSNSAKPLSRILIKKTFGNITTVVSDSLIDSTAFSYIYLFTSNGSAGDEKWTFIATDEAGRSDSIRFTITTQTFPPTVDFIFDNRPLQVGASFMLAINASANTTTYENISRVRITRTFGTFVTTELDTSLNIRNFSYFNTYLASSDPGTENWVFRADDISGEWSQVTLQVITIEAPLTEYTGVIWNAIGGNNFAWDLVSNQPRALSEPDSSKDMINNSSLSTCLPPFNFSNSWIAGNQTRFKRANWYVYENASTQTAIDAYSGGTISHLPSATAQGLANGDIFIARLRGTNNYAVIRITNVEWTSGDDLDKIEFTYKK